MLDRCHLVQLEQGRAIASRDQLPARVMRSLAMALRDHFRPPVSKRSSWEGFHGGWPMRIVEELAPRLPDGFVAEPRVHLGSFYEIDVCAFEQQAEEEPGARAAQGPGGPDG